MRKKVTLIFFDAGGGHRSAANALRTVIERQGRPWQIELLNLQELLDPLDPFLSFTGIRVQDIYNRILTNGLTLGTAQLLKVLHLLIRIWYPQVVRELAKYWNVNRPDMVVSLIPNFNRALAESLHQSVPGTPFVTILTDLADYPPHFWMERESEYLICGTDRAVQQARALDHSDERIYRTSGMILNPMFYEPAPDNRAQERERLALDPELPTGLVLFGGVGSKVMLEIVERLDRSKLHLQLILICGHNRKLADKLRMQKTRIPMFVQDFTRKIPYYMYLSDFFIGKTGPGSISEAIAMRLPVIVERNAWTMPQERYNAEWIVENGVGIVLSGFRSIVPAVERLLEPATLTRFRAQCGMIKNEAVFEIPGYLDQILTRNQEANSRQMANATFVS